MYILLMMSHPLNQGRIQEGGGGGGGAEKFQNKNTFSAVSIFFFFTSPAFDYNFPHSSLFIDKIFIIQYQLGHRKNKTYTLGLSKLLVFIEVAMNTDGFYSINVMLNFLYDRAANFLYDRAGTVKHSG